MLVFFLQNDDQTDELLSQCKSMPLVRRGLTPLVPLLVRHSK